VVPISPVYKPLLGERVNAKGEGVLAWYEVLVIKGTDVIVAVDIIVVGGEELVFAISKNNIISKK
jgi:hypothetical protein